MAARTATQVLLSLTSVTSTVSSVRPSSGRSTTIPVTVSVPVPATSEFTSTVHWPSVVPSVAQVPPVSVPVSPKVVIGVVPSGTDVQVTPSSVCWIVTVNSCSVRTSSSPSSSSRTR